MVLCVLLDAIIDGHHCPGTFDEGARTFTSPNYPASYNNDWHCTWQIRAPKGKKVKLTFKDFEMDSSDYLRIYDSKGGKEFRTFKLIAKLNGKKLPSDIISDSEYLSIDFTSDGTGSLKGFKIEFDA